MYIITCDVINYVNANNPTTTGLTDFLKCCLNMKIYSMDNTVQYSTHYSTETQYIYTYTTIFKKLA